MTELATGTSPSTLPGLIDRAANALQGARSSAEVLEARELAGFAYDAAKAAGRLAKAKGAHDDVIAAVHRAQADALEIEAAAKRRLADEYDAAQGRGEVRGANQRTASRPEAVGAEDVGLTHKDVHEARALRDAENAAPGIVRKTLDAALEAGEEPTKARVKKAAADAVRGDTPRPDTRRTNSTTDDELADEVAELKAINEDLTAENTNLKAQLAILEPMRLEYERGGLAEVIKGLGEQVRVLKTRVETESQEKVKNLRSANYWKQKAIEHGFSRNAVIDLETLEEVKHG